MAGPSGSGDLQRVAVVGTSCSGKSEFSAKLSAVLGVSHIELDALYWQPNWTKRSDVEFRDLLAREVSAERWVADGNYSMVRDIVWSRATDVIWLNYSFPMTFSRALRRTVSRAAKGEELFSGNRETIRQSFFSKDSILLWVMRTYWKNRFEYWTLQDSDDWKHIRFTEFRNSTQASEFLAHCKTT